MSIFERARGALDTLVGLALDAAEARLYPGHVKELAELRELNELEAGTFEELRRSWAKQHDELRAEVADLRTAKEERDQAVAAHAAAVEQAAKDAAEARRQYGVLQGLLRDATTEREVLRTERNQARRNFDGQAELAQGLQRQLDALREAAWVLIRQLHALAGAATDADDVLKANLTGGVHSAEAAEVVAALRALHTLLLSRDGGAS